MEVETTLPEGSEAAATPGASGLPVGGLAAGLAAEHGATNLPSASPAGPVEPPRNKGGRPPIHGRYSKAAGSDGHKPAPLPRPEPVEAPQADAEPAAGVVVPPDLLSKVVSELLGTGEAYAQNKIAGVAVQSGLTMGEVAPQLKQAAMGEKRKETIGQLTPLMLEEWGINPKMSPTVAVCALLGPWALAAGSAYLTLADLAAQRKAQQNSHPKGEQVTGK